MTTPHDAALEAVEKARLGNQLFAKTGYGTTNEDELIVQTYLRTLLSDPRTLEAVALAFRLHENGDILDDIDPVFGYLGDADAAITALRRIAGVE